MESSNGSVMATLEPIIKEILENSDLGSVSAKAVRRTLINRGTAKDMIKTYKSQVDSTIERIYTELRTGSTSVPSGSIKTEIEEERSDPEQEVQIIRPSKKAKHDPVAQSVDDEAYARALQDQFDGTDSQRSSRSNPSGTRSSGKATSKGRYKSSATIGSDDEDAASGVAKSATKKRKRKVTADGEPPANNAFNKSMVLSPSLSTLLGETHLSRPKVVQALWVYIKKNELQDPKDKRYIACDPLMRSVFNTDRVHMMGMNKVLSKHLYDPDDIVGQ